MRVLYLVSKLSSVLLTVLSLWAGYWIAAHIQSVDTWPSLGGLIFDYFLNFRSPVPYFVFVVGVEVWSYVAESSATREVKTLKQQLAEKNDFEKELRLEKQEHAESKSSYSDTLEVALKLMLCVEATGFDYRCRVTIYRRQTQTDSGLRQIFRFSENHSYKIGGRYKIPLNEGVVGAAWNNHGVKHVSIEHDTESTAFADEMGSKIGIEECRVPDCQLSMPSKEFYAKALEDHENGHRVGVVVYECTEQGVFDVENIDSLLTTRSMELARFVKHLGRLDIEFAPSVGEE